MRSFEENMRPSATPHGGQHLPRHARRDTAPAAHSRRVGLKMLKAIEINYKKNVMGNMRWTNDWINSDGKYLEYLFLMQKN